MTEEEIIRILEDFGEYFQNNNIFAEAFRFLGWMIVKAMASVTDLCSQLYDWAFKLVDITSWTSLDTYLDTYRPLISAILLASIVVLGFMFILGKNKNHPIFSSILMFAVVVTSSNFLFATFNEAAFLFKDTVAGTGEGNAYEVIADNTYDLLYIDQQIGLANMKEGGIPRAEELTEKDVELMDITETIDYGSDYITTDEAKDILKKKLVIRQDGERWLDDVYNGVAWTDMFNEFYFRYKVNFGTVIISILALMLVYILLAYKCVAIIFELLAGRILAVLYAGNMSGNQKMVRILLSIRDGYFALCFTAVSLKLFLLMQSFMSSKDDMPGLIRGSLLLFMAWCVINGANLMEKITGVDAGLSGGAGKLIALQHLVGGTMRNAAGIGSLLRQRQMAGDIKAQTEALQNMQRDSGNSGAKAGSSGNTSQTAGTGNGENNEQTNMAREDNQTNDQKFQQDDNGQYAETNYNHGSSGGTENIDNMTAQEGAAGTGMNSGAAESEAGKPGEPKENAVNNMEEGQAKDPNAEGAMKNMEANTGEHMSDMVNGRTSMYTQADESAQRMNEALNGNDSYSDKQYPNNGFNAEKENFDEDIHSETKGSNMFEGARQKFSENGRSSYDTTGIRKTEVFPREDTSNQKIDGISGREAEKEKHKQNRGDKRNKRKDE